MTFRKAATVRLLLAFAVPLLAPEPGRSMGNPSELCREAAAAASVRSGVPYAVLLAIATVESGRNDQPWPWTVNFGGDGQWFDSPAEAADSVAQALRDGATNLDLGCFQLNYRWHAAAFASIDEMLDPVRNANYAAEYLAKQYARTGDWALAAAAYHSATPEYAAAYRGKFETAYARLSGATVIEGPALPDRKNGFPLLLAGGSGRNGSLFSATTGLRPLIGGP
ncbi:MAG: transglycosylase SLT domain-containing protein [Tabrizicola sp.]